MSRVDRSISDNPPQFEYIESSKVVKLKEHIFEFLEKGH